MSENRIKVLKEMYQHRGEKRYRVSAVNRKTGKKYDDLSCDFDEKSFNNFMSNGGEDAMCVVCDYRSGLESGSASGGEINELRENWLTQAEALSEDFPEDDIRRDLLEEAKNIQPLASKSSRFGEGTEEEVEDQDGDGIPDDEDRIDDRETPSEEISFKGNQYFDYPKGVQDKGQSGQKLDETSYLPSFVPRPDDVILGNGGKNNTYIVLGRDRTGQSENLKLGPDGKAANLDSGFGDHQAAGAIDIVVGRGAPYPVKNMNIGPIFITDNTLAKDLRKEKLAEKNKHPGYMMDAARIYISQKTNADLNFGINDSSRDTKEISIDRMKKMSQISDPKGAVKKELKNKKVSPKSAIVAKADQVRLVARENIKLVTSGPEEIYNSQGGQLKSIQGIDLIAGNGMDAFGGENDQEPIPKGKMLLEAMDGLVGLLHDLAAIIEAILMSQMEFNAFVMTHFHLSPLWGIPTTPSPLLPFAGMKTMIDHLVRGYLGIIMLRVNLNGFNLNYLQPSSKKYILSRYNTTN